MIEVEKKCTLSDKPKLRDNLLDNLYKKACFIKEIKKEDVYYIKQEQIELFSSLSSVSYPSLLSSAKIFRIRKIGKKNIITFKTKSLINSTEVNNEEEFSTLEIDAFKKFASYLGFAKFIEKIKEIKLFSYEDISLEFVYIYKLGYFLEAEVLCEREDDIPQIIKKIDKVLFEDFSLRRESVETMMYIELLLLRKDSFST